MKSLVVFLLFSNTVLAQTSETSNLILKAHEESKTQRIEQASATDAQISYPAGDSVLSLVDPDPGPVVRAYRWILGLKFQNHKALGILQSPDKQLLDLDLVEAVSLPSLEVGVEIARNPTWQWGALFHVGYASQSTQATYNLFGGKQDSRLNTILADVGVYGNYDLNSVFGLEASLGVGLLSYTQTGSSARSQFSSEAPFQFTRLGSSAKWNSNWQTFAAWTGRELLTTDSTFSTPKDSFELGTRYVW